MILLESIHHIAVICSDYERSKDFYTRILGLEIVHEVYRQDRKSYKLDLALNGQYIIELFSFPDPLPRPSSPESCGLRHLAFRVDNVSFSVERLERNGIKTETIRVDPYTDKKFTFFNDPDGLPLELYEV